MRMHRVSRAMALATGLLVVACGKPQPTPPSIPQLVFPDRPPPKSHRYRDHSLVELPDGQRRVFVIKEGDYSDIVQQSRQSDGSWSPPEIVDLPRREINTSPRIDPRNGDMYYSSDAQHPERRGRSDLNIWRVSPTADGWGEPEVLPDIINSGGHEDGFALTPGGVAIFSSARTTGEGGYDLYVATPSFTELDRWEVQPWPHNTLLADSHPALSPDGKLLVWYAHMPREQILGRVDLFFSQKTADGWTVPRPFGPMINSVGIDYSPGFSADGRKFYYSQDGRLFEVAVEAALADALQAAN